MGKQKTSSHGLDERIGNKTNIGDKRDTAEKSPTGEVLKDLTTVIPGEMHDSPIDEEKASHK